MRYFATIVLDLNADDKAAARKIADYVAAMIRHEDVYDTWADEVEESEEQ